MVLLCRCRLSSSAQLLSAGFYMLEQIFSSLAAVIIVLAMAAVGYVLGRLGYINKGNKKLLIKLIIGVGMPSLVVNTVFGKLNFAGLDRPWLLFLLPFLSMTVTLAIGLLLCRLLAPSPERRGGFIAMCAFSNSVFIGLPMNTGLFGDAAVPYVMAFYVVNTTLFWTIGNFVISKSGETGTEKGGILKSLKKLISPPLIALAVSIPFAALGVKMPKAVITLSGYMGNIVTPLALFYIGYALYEYGFGSMKLDKSMICVTLVRFIIAPAAMIALCRLFRFDGMPAAVFIIEAAMPVMTQAVVVAGSHDADEAFVAGGMCVTTLCCFIEVPLLMLLMQLMGMI